MSSRSSSELSSDRGSPVTRPGSSATGSSVNNYMGQKCSVDGCSKLCFTGGPLCQLHAGHKRGSTPLLGPSQLKPAASSSASPAGPKPILTRMVNSYKTLGQIKPDFAQDTLASQTDRRPDTPGASPQSQKNDSPRKLLDAKFAARKTATRPKPSQPISNSAAATEAEIVVASSPEPAVRSEENHQDDESAGPPRKKARTSPARTEPSLRSTSGPNGSGKCQSPTIVPKPPVNKEGLRVDNWRRIGENKNFNLRAQTENPSLPTNGTVGRENAHAKPRDFQQPTATSTANIRPKAPEIREVFKIQARGDAECLGATRPVQRILPAPAPTLARPSPPSGLANSKSPNPPVASTAQKSPDQTVSRATPSPSIIAPQPQARNQNHVLNRETSFGQVQLPKKPLFGNLLDRQDSHSHSHSVPTRPAKISPRPSPLLPERATFDGFGLHPNLNERSAGLGRSQSPNSEILRRQQDSKPRPQPVNSAQGNNTQSNGVSHTAKAPESTPSSNVQTTGNDLRFDLKLAFLHFNDPSRAEHQAATQQQIQTAQTAQNALNYSTAVTHNRPNGDLSKKPSPSPQLPTAASVPGNIGPRAIAPLVRGQNGRKVPSEPPRPMEVICLDSSSDEDTLRRPGSVRPPPPPPQPSVTQQIEQTQEEPQEKQTIPNGSAVASQLSTKMATNGITATVVSRDKTSNSDRPLMNSQKISPAPEAVTNGSGSNTSDLDRSLMDRRRTTAALEVEANGSGGKSSDSDRPLMDRRRTAAIRRTVITPAGGKGLDSDRSPKTMSGHHANGSVTAANPSGDKISDSDRPLLTPDQRWKNVTPQRWQQLTPLERRKMLVDMHDADVFDAAIYSKANESSHPKSVFYDVPSYALRATASSRPMPKTSGHFNPWTHWTHARTPEWHAQKQKEIKARGNRKDPRNFGQAAKRLAQGKAKREHLLSQELPDRVKTNPAWMDALEELDTLTEAYREDQRIKMQQRKKRKKGKAKAQLDKDGDVQMDSSGSGGDEPVQRRTEFVLHRGEWTVAE